MERLTDYPLLLFLAAFAAMWLASGAGLWLRNRTARVSEARSEDFDIITAATLTLLGLTIGFTYSMAAYRYDQRKVLEASEANAIGTEVLRADLLPPSDAASVRALLVAYLDQRNLFFAHEDPARRAQINQRTDQLQAELWTAVRGPAAAQPTPVTALVVAGMNDVLNSRGYTQAALWNRIPAAAWALMAVIALFCNVLFAYRSRITRAWRPLALVLPLIVSISLLLIADIDAPQRGLIRVVPQNLESLAQSLRR